MNSNTNEIKYAKLQVREARRRLESVEERIKETKERDHFGAIDWENEKLVLGEKIEQIPEDHRQIVPVGKSIEEETNVQGHIQNIIIDCQMSIELAVKSMFKAVGQDFDYSHGIGFGSANTQGFNNKIPNEFSRNEDIVRAIFLTQVWEKFYQIAKYGAPELNVGPTSMFEINDGERAINDATFCVELAEDLIDHMDNIQSS